MGVKLSPEAFKWLYDFVDAALMIGLSDRSTLIPAPVWNELSRHNLVERTGANYVNYAWHGKVQLVSSFKSDLIQGMNLYGLVTETVYESHIKQVVQQQLAEVNDGENTVADIDC